MAGVSVTALGEAEFDVVIDDHGTTTSHRVRVTDTALDRLGVAEVDQARLVRESFIFLLEREPATSILTGFDLDVIARYFPEYYDTVRARLRAD